MKKTLMLQIVVWILLHDLASAKPFRVTHIEVDKIRCVNQSKCPADDGLRSNTLPDSVTQCSHVTCHTTNDVKIASPVDRSSFCQCEGKDAVLRKCPMDLSFNAQLQACDNEAEGEGLNKEGEEKYFGSSMIRTRRSPSAFDEGFGKIFNVVTDTEKFKNLTCGERIHNQVKMDAAVVGTTFVAVGGLLGAVQGAMEGFAIGSVVPGIGNVVGGIVGGIIGAATLGSMAGAFGAAVGVLDGAVKCGEDPFKYDEDIATVGETAGIIRKIIVNRM